MDIRCVFGAPSAGRVHCCRYLVRTDLIELAGRQVRGRLGHGSKAILDIGIQGTHGPHHLALEGERAR